jgi:hypothetical protein
VKVPENQTIYIGGKKYKAGKEIPSDLADKIKTDKPAKPAKPKPSGGDKPKP